MCPAPRRTSPFGDCAVIISENRCRRNNHWEVMGEGMSPLQREGLHELEAFPLLFYFIANDGSHAPNHNGHDPSHHGLHSRGLENSRGIHNHGHNHAPRKGVGAENTLTTSDHRGAESQ